MGAVIQLYRECLGSSPCRFGQRNFLPLRRRSPARRRSAAPRSPCPTCAAASATSSPRWPRRASPRSTGIELIYRGYERFSEKLDGLGADYEVG